MPLQDHQVVQLAVKKMQTQLGINKHALSYHYQTIQQKKNSMLTARDECINSKEVNVSTRALAMLADKAPSPSQPTNTRAIRSSSYNYGSPTQLTIHLVNASNCLA